MPAHTCGQNWPYVHVCGCRPHERHPPRSHPRLSARSPAARSRSSAGTGCLKRRLMWWRPRPTPAPSPSGCCSATTTARASRREVRRAAAAAGLPRRRALPLACACCWCRCQWRLQLMLTCVSLLLLLLLFLLLQTLHLSPHNSRQQAGHPRRQHPHHAQRLCLPLLPAAGAGAAPRQAEGRRHPTRRLGCAAATSTLDAIQQQQQQGVCRPCRQSPHKHSVLKLPPPAVPSPHPTPPPPSPQSRPLCASTTCANRCCLCAASLTASAPAAA